MHDLVMWMNDLSLICIVQYPASSIEQETGTKLSSNT